MLLTANSKALPPLLFISLLLIFFFFPRCFLCSLSLCPILLLLHLLYLLPLWQLSVQLPTSTASPSRQQRVLQLKEISLFSGLLFLQQEVQRIICRHECKTGTQDFLAHVKIWCSDRLSLKTEIFQEYQKCILNAYSKVILNVHVVCVYSIFCQILHSVPLDSYQSISTSSISLLLSPTINCHVKQHTILSLR